jgi:hypothetical protein
MSAVLARDGNTIRVDYVVWWYGRIFALLLLAASLGLLFLVFLGVKQDLSGEDAWSDNLPGLLILTVLGIAIGLPGFMMLTFRYFVVVETMPGNVTVNRQFGPLTFRRPRKLADFNLISIVDSGDQRGTTFDVALCGRSGTKPIVLAGFGERQDADDFAREMGSALRLPFKDLVGTEPEDPDLEAEAEAAGAKARHKGRTTEVAKAA